MCLRSLLPHLPMLYVYAVNSSLFNNVNCAANLIFLHYCGTGKRKHSEPQSK